MSELPVPAVAPPELPKPQTLVCANCGTDLTGEYCGACGQRHEPHIHTVSHFAGEAMESITHADSRLWRTLWLLFARPGWLTREFFAGRRARYLPPFRLYLVLSVIFFLVTAIGGGSDPDPGAAPAGAVATGVAPVAATPAAAPDERGINIRIQGLDDFCQPFEAPEPGGDGRLARDNIRKFCFRVRHDGAALGEAVLHNIPKAMFLFLPLLAAVMKLLYWRPKRYYVEHLLFLVHNHAAVFLVFSVIALLSLIPWVGELSGFYSLAGLAYMAWYIFRAMRNVYGQRGWLTFAKYVFLFWTYVFTAVITMLITLIFTAVAG